MIRVPVVIVHIGDSYYLKNVVEVNASKNPVIFVGCEKNAYLAQIPNVKHIHYKTLEDSYVEFLKANFYALEKGYDTTYVNVIQPGYNCVDRPTLEFLWILRIYYVKKILEQENLEFIMHLDSDCFMLENTNTLFEAIGNRVALNIEHIHDNIHLVASVHNSFLNVEFCNQFFKLYEDVYVNKTKRYLIKDKIDAIVSGRAGGFICDMNFYYILWKEKLVDMFDLSQPFLFENEFCVMDHNISKPTGFYGSNTYKLSYGSKLFTYENGKVYQESIDGRKIRLLSMHFNDSAKQQIEAYRKRLFPDYKKN
jgi:hypothetical protein